MFQVPDSLTLPDNVASEDNSMSISNPYAVKNLAKEAEKKNPVGNRMFLANNKKYKCIYFTY